MALFPFDSILAALGGTWSNRNKVEYWSGWITGDGPKRDVNVTAVSFSETGLELRIKDGAADIELKAIPVDDAHTDVYLDGAKVNGAAMVFDIKPTITDFTRFAFDFRPVPMNGNKARFNMRYDP